MSLCPQCDWINSDQDLYCARCGESLKPQEIKIDQPLTSSTSAIERNVIVSCCVLSLLLFFFPLLTIRVPIVGDQEVSGYDVLSKLTQLQENIALPKERTLPNRQGSIGETATPNLPLSVQLIWLTPLALIVAFVCAASALILTFKAIHASRIFCVIGAASAGFAILHITIMNSDMHSWLAESMKATRSELNGNPFAGLADNIGTLIVNAFQIKPGWAVYAVLVLLSLAAILGFSRVLSRIRLVPVNS